MISYVFLKSASHNFVSYFIQECLGILAARCAGLSVIALFSADSTKQKYPDSYKAFWLCNLFRIFLF